MLFAEPFNLQNIMPWVIVALAILMLIGILGKCVSIYRKLKQNQNKAKLNEKTQAEQTLNAKDTQDKDIENNDENV